MSDQLMDFTRVEAKPLYQRVLQSLAFKLTLLALVVGSVAWAYWYTMVRVNVPVGIQEAVRKRDEAFNQNDANKYLTLISPQCDTQVDGEVYTYEMIAEWIKWHFANTSDSTRETVLHDSFTRSDGKVEVKGSSTRKFTFEGKKQVKLVKFTSVWYRVTGGWIQESYRGKVKDGE